MSILVFRKCICRNNVISKAVDQRYDFRQRIHSLQLPEHSTHYRTVTFSCACYIKTNRPTRPTQFHFSSSHCVYLFVYFRVLFIVLYVWPAFCHAIIKRIGLLMMMILSFIRNLGFECRCGQKWDDDE